MADPAAARGRRGLAAAAAAALALLLACAAPAPAAATSPLQFDFGGGLVSVDANGKVVLENEWKAGVSPAQGAAALAAAAASAKAAAAGAAPAGAAGVSPAAAGWIKAAVEAGSDAASPLGAWYVATWSGVSSPKASDRVAVLYSAKPTSDNNPREYFFVGEVAPSTWQSGSGSARFWLPFLREAVTFAYIRENTWRVGIWWSFDIIAGAVVSPPSNTRIPHNIKLSFQTYNSVAAVWQTTGSAPGASVRWRKAGSTYSSGTFGTRVAARATYRPGSLCDSPAKDAGYSTPGFIYSATMTNLSEGSRYYYQVGSQSDGWSAEMSFVTPPAASDAARQTRVLLTADMGMYSQDQSRYPDGNAFQYLKYAPSDAATPGTKSYAASQALLMTTGAGPGQQPATRDVFAALRRAAAAQEYHALVINGDISYARGESHQWDVWSTEANPLASAIPAVYSAGNHEADDKKYPDSPFGGIDSGGECNVPYRHLLHMPQPSGATSDWFAVTVGPIRMIQLNSEQYINTGSRQYKWLVGELAAVNRTATPWLIVGMHRPMYVDTVDTSDQNVATNIANAIEDLLVKYEVDAVWTGHIHALQRSCVGVVKGNCLGTDSNGDALGPLHIMTGNAGFQSPLQTFDKAPGWLAYSSFDYGFTEVTATRTSMTLKSFSTSGAVLDIISLNKSASWKPDPAKAAARYAAATRVPLPPTIDTFGLYAQMGVSFVITALGDSAWTQKYLQPSSRLWQLTTSLPGNVTVWSIQDVWQVAYPVISLVAENPPLWMSATNKAATQYLYKMIKPGGRLYFGGNLGAPHDIFTGASVP